MANKNLAAARNAKNDEFYTQYADIQKEVNAYLDFDPNVFRGKTILLPCDDPEWSNFTKFFAQNFEAFGLKKLISTSYAVESKNAAAGSSNPPYQSKRSRGRATSMKSPHSPTGYLYSPTLFETQSSHYDATKTRVRGKIFVLDHDANCNGRIDIEDLEWTYLEGDGDFRSQEVRALRDEADIIVTNPPFSLFREFLAWIIEADKKFLIIGNKNAVTYREVFPLVKSNGLWAGSTNWTREIYFDVPEGFKNSALAACKDRTIVLVNGRHMARSQSVWYTNMEHGRRHQPLSLMSEKDNIKYSKHQEVKGIGYRKYDNYDAIEVPFYDAIPSDHAGAMGVPISFIDKYCPEQFEILGATESEGKGFSCGLWDPTSDVAQPLVLGEKIYKRIFIRHRHPLAK